MSGLSLTFNNRLTQLLGLQVKLSSRYNENNFWYVLDIYFIDIYKKIRVLAKHVPLGRATATPRVSRVSLGIFPFEMTSFMFLSQERDSQKFSTCQVLFVV